MTVTSETSVHKWHTGLISTFFGRGGLMERLEHLPKLSCLMCCHSGTKAFTHRCDPTQCTVQGTRKVAPIGPPHTGKENAPKVWRPCGPEFLKCPTFPERHILSKIFEKLFSAFMRKGWGCFANSPSCWHHKHTRAQSQLRYQRQSLVLTFLS